MFKHFLLLLVSILAIGCAHGRAHHAGAHGAPAMVHGDQMMIAPAMHVPAFEAQNIISSATAYRLQQQAIDQAYAAARAGEYQAQQEARARSATELQLSGAQSQLQAQDRQLEKIRLELNLSREEFDALQQAWASSLIKDEQDNEDDGDHPLEEKPYLGPRWLW